MSFPVENLSLNQPLSPVSVSPKPSLLPPLPSWAECQLFQAPPLKSPLLYILIGLKPQIPYLLLKAIQKLPSYFPNSQDPAPWETWHDLTSWAFPYLGLHCTAPPYLSARILLILQRPTQILALPLESPIFHSRKSFSFSMSTTLLPLH